MRVTAYKTAIVDRTHFPSHHARVKRSFFRRVLSVGTLWLTLLGVAQPVMACPSAGTARDCCSGSVPVAMCCVASLPAAVVATGIDHAARLLLLPSDTPEPNLPSYFGRVVQANNPRTIPRYRIHDRGPDNGTQIYLRTTRLRL